MTDDPSLLIPQPFDYSQLPDTLALSLKDRAHRIRTTYENAIIEMGRELSEAQAELAHHGDGTFGAWTQSELGLSRSSAYNLINVYTNYKVRPNVWTNLSLSRSALYLLAQPSTPDHVVDDIARRLESGEKITHQDVKTAVRKAKGPTEFQQRVGKRIIATLKEMGPLALTDLCKYAGYIEINIKAALRHLDQVTLQETPDGAEVYWFTDKPFPADDMTVGEFRAQFDSTEPPAAPSPADELRAIFHHDAITILGRSDEGAWHRAIEVARKLVAAGLWDGETPIEFDAYTLHNRLFGVEHLPVTDLIAGEDYTILPPPTSPEGVLDIPDHPATPSIDEPDVPPTPIPLHATEGPGEQSDPMGSGVSIPADADPDAALTRRILTALQSGPKSLTELAKHLPAHPQDLLPVVQRLATVKPVQIHRIVAPGSGGIARYSLVPTAGPEPFSPPVGKNGPGVPDSADPEVEGALQVRRDLEGACVTLLKSIENFTRIKSITSLAALDADRLAETEKLLDQVYHRSTAARQHATGLIVQIRAQAPAPSDEAVTADGR